MGNLNTRRILFLCLTIASLCALLLYFFAFGIVRAGYHLPMDVEISGKLGINGDSDALHFGSVQPGGWAKKSIILSNNNTYILRVALSGTGNITPYLVFPENNFMLKSNETKTLDLWVQTPDTIGYGRYVGDLRVIMKREFRS